MKQQLILYSALLFLLVGCGTAEKIEIKKGTPKLIETKAQVKSNDETHSLKIDIAVDPNRSIRLEVSGTLNVKVASVLMTPEKVQYALHTKQIFAEGPFESKTMKPIFNQPVDPKIIWKIVHEEVPQGPEIKCQFNALQNPLSCTGEKNITIRWTYENNKRKRIDLKADSFEMNWLFKNEKILSVSQTETFVLKKPDGYKEISIK